MRTYVASQTPYRSAAVSKNAKEERAVSRSAWVSFDEWKSCPVCPETARHSFVSRKLPSACDLFSLSLSSGSLQADFRRHYLLAGRFFSSPSPSFARSCVITALLGFELGEPTRNVAIASSVRRVGARPPCATHSAAARNAIVTVPIFMQSRPLLRHICNL